MPGRARAVEPLRDVAHLDERLKAGRVDVARVGDVGDVGARGRGLREITRQVARVAREILGGCELRRVHEDRERELVAAPPAPRAAARTCPSCSAPIVGTNAIRSPRARAASEPRRHLARRTDDEGPCRGRSSLLKALYSKLSSLEGKRPARTSGGVGREGLADKPCPSRRSGARSAAATRAASRAGHA